MNQHNNKLHQDTEKRIQEALLQLLEEKTPDNISVQALCRSAKINRSTFYRHYTDVYDLMEKVERKIQRGIVEVWTEHDPASALFDREDLIRFVSYIGENRKFYRAYLRIYPANQREKDMQTVFDSYFRPIFLSFGVESTPHMNYYYRFFHAGLQAVLGDWLEKSSPESPEELAGILLNMLRQDVL